MNLGILTRIFVLAMGLIMSQSSPAQSWSETLLQLRATESDKSEQASHPGTPVMRQIVFPEAGTNATDSAAHVQAQAETELTRLLVGVYVNGVEKTALLALHDGEQYLMPLVTVLELIGVSIDESGIRGNDNAMALQTPGGPAVLSDTDIRVVGGQILITEAGLRDTLLIDVRFEQSEYAIFLILPWSLAVPADVFAGIDMPEPDFAPPSLSMRSLRGDLYITEGADGIATSGDYYMSGSMVGGAWQARVAQDSLGGIRASDYFLTRDFANSLMLLGNSDYSLHPLMPTVEQTGMQWLYSSQPLSATSEVDISRARSVKRLNNGVRTVSGLAAPGAIAELRVDGNVRSRVRARLDGSYEFPDVELPTRGYSQVEVLIRDFRTGALVEVQDFSRRSGVELLGDGQHSVFAALGQEGNPFDPLFATRGMSSAAQWRYGLTEDITFELGHQRVGEQQDSSGAVSMALARRWFSSLGVADNDKQTAASFALEGGGERWSLDLGARETRLKAEQQTDAQEISSRQWNRYFNLNFRASDRLSLGLIARDGYGINGAKRFALPSASWSNRRNLSINIRPNYKGEYRVDSRFTPTRNLTARYSIENSRQSLDLRHIGRGGQEYYGNVSMDEGSQARLEFGMVSEFENPRLGRIQVGVVSGDDALGYALDWESQLLPGVNSRMRITQAESASFVEETGNDFSFQWQLTFDFAVAQKRIVAADSRMRSLDSATLTGDLMLGGEKLNASFDVERIDLLIDGNTHTARVQGGRYFIDGLSPGMHKVSIDSKHLPLELSPVNDQNYWVRLEKSAVTEVPVALEIKFSAAGRVRDQRGTNLQNARMVLMDESGQVIETLASDQFGLYRTGNLSPGHYRLVVRQGEKDIGNRDIVISDAYLFEQDLVANPSPISDSPLISL